MSGAYASARAALWHDGASGAGAPRCWGSLSSGMYASTMAALWRDREWRSAWEKKMMHYVCYYISELFRY